MIRIIVKVLNTCPDGGSAAEWKTFDVELPDIEGVLSDANAYRLPSIVGCEVLRPKP